MIELFYYILHPNRRIDNLFFRSVCCQTGLLQLL